MIQRILGSALAVCLTATMASAQSALPEPGVPQSVGVQLKGPDFTVDTIAKVHEMGFGFVRKGIYWDGVEKEKGKYDFSKSDEVMNDAKAKGLRVVLTLFNSNKLYEDDGRGGIQTEEGRKGFAAFGAAAAEHYKDHHVLWEVWNEPNVRTFWRKDGMHNSEPFAQEYTDLVKATVPAMLKADPNAFVMAGSVSNYWKPSYEWTEFCFQKGILTSGIKGWSVHPYGVKTPEDFAVGHGITRELLKKYGAPSLPMIDTERGFAIKKPAGQLELEGWSGGEGEQVRNYQAAHFVRQFMVDQLNGVVITSWYEWNGDEFGIIGKEGTRPIETAARFMISRLNGYKLDQRLKSENPQDYLVIWKDAAGKRQLVAWTSPPSGGAPDEARPHEVAIKTTGAGQFETADLFGKTSTSDTLKLTISGLPQYVSLPAGVQLGEITTSAPAPVAPAAATPAEHSAPQGTDLKLFADADAWKFEKNTGEGSFALAKDGDEPIGVVQYDFSKSNAKSTPYVLAMRDIDVATGGQIGLDVRTEIAQPLTFRIVDSTKQTLQFKYRAKGGNQWESVKIPLNKKLEHWGGDNDGQVHFPVKQIVFSVPQPSDDHKTGKVEYARVSAGAAAAAEPGQKKPEQKKPEAKKEKPAAKPAAEPAADAGPVQPAGDLKLFDAPSKWEFTKNTGEGSFDVAKDGDKPIGVLNFDFTNSKAKGTPYVLAFVPVAIGDDATAIQLSVRCKHAQKLTFRVVDSTGQTHQFKSAAKGTGDWETITIPLDKKLEHWDGDNDGKVHFPVKKLAISLPAGDTKTGKVEFSVASSVAKK